MGFPGELAQIWVSCGFCFVLLGVVRMAVSISSSNPRAALFRDWVREMGIFLGLETRWHPLGGLESILDAWRRVMVNPRDLVCWYRDGGFEHLGVGSGDPLWAYVARCLGHRLDRRVVLGCPRVAVMCACSFYGGRWDDCEVVLGDDWVACYLYAVVRGGLSDCLRNRLVMEGMVRKDEALVRCLRDFG